MDALIRQIQSLANVGAGTARIAIPDQTGQAIENIRGSN